MSDAEQTPEPLPPAQQPQAASRRTAGATARIIREMDMMRAGLDAILRDVSAGQLALECPPGLKVQDQIKIKLHHVVQRFEKEVRGLVRKIEPIDAQSERLTVELFTRLTPVEVGVLKMGIDVDQNAGPRWV
ncbi:MAG TPA: hypothetical protein VFG04_06150 [Planctomycetaceae bacterium]|jgi:hypothetical protein|nr:hypothetical protein [Planctomycetaceae bacterium]